MASRRLLLYAVLWLPIVILAALYPRVSASESPSLSADRCIDADAAVPVCKPAPLSPVVRDAATRLCTTLIGDEALPIHITDYFGMGRQGSRFGPRRDIECRYQSELYILRVSLRTGVLLSVNRLEEGKGGRGGTAHPGSSDIPRAAALRNAGELLALAGVPSGDIRLIRASAVEGDNGPVWLLEYDYRRCGQRRLTVGLDGTTGRLDSYWTAQLPGSR